jgi:phosphoribosylformylglycinamidine synthase PurS subunit
MRVRIVVTLKPTVLDPQGLTIQRNLETAGISGVREVRQGKYFEVEVSDDVSAEERRTVVEKLARDVLANPVIESYEILWD